MERAANELPGPSARGWLFGFSTMACLVCSVAALAQTAPPPSVSANPPGAVQAPPPDAATQKRDGFFDALGRWFEKSAQDFKASVEESNAKWRELSEKTEKAAKDAAAAQKDAAEAFKNLSNVRIVEGKRTCDIAPNGSPDCQPAAEHICRKRGFATGKSADIQTSRRCSARAWLNRDEGDCKTETVVVKAACQ